MQQNPHDVEGALIRGWHALSQTAKDDFNLRFVQIKEAREAERETAGGARQTLPDSELKREERDEDTEMADDSGTPAAAVDTGGFTAVNRA